MKKIGLDKKYSVVFFSLSCITEEKDFITSDQKGLLICFIKDSEYDFPKFIKSFMFKFDFMIYCHLHVLLRIINRLIQVAFNPLINTSIFIIFNPPSEYSFTSTFCFIIGGPSHKKSSSMVFSCFTILLVGFGKDINR